VLLSAVIPVAAVLANSARGGPMPGLCEGLIANGTNDFDLTDPIPDTSLQLTTRYANSTIGQGSTGGGPFPNFPDNSTWGYEGLFNVSLSMAGPITFAEKFDDSLLLKIDGAIVLNDNQWLDQTQNTVNLAAGAHTIELRLGQGIGGVGPVFGGIDGNTDLGVGFSLNGGATWLPFTDPGDGSLLTCAASAPEPAMMSLMGVAGAGLLLRRRRAMG
jgi:hypothetical protein